jgi:hypothetical protein
MPEYRSTQHYSPPKSSPQPPCRPRHRVGDSCNYPVFLAFGERPRDEVAFYTNSCDLGLVVLKDAAHCHNFAATRHALWDRIASWLLQRRWVLRLPSAVMVRQNPTQPARH